MKMFALRIPDELKKRMDQTKINWSDYLRQSIGEALDSSKKRELMLKIQRVSTKRKVPAGTAVQAIRRIRNGD